MAEAADTVDRLKKLRADHMQRLWPAAEAAAETATHEALVELIKIYTAINAIDFAIAHRPDPLAATRTRVGF